MTEAILLAKLFWEFFKTGLLSVGGGLATLPFLTDMAVRTGWFTESELADMVAVAESTPGPIGVNTATYVGYTTAGIPGGIIATLGLIAPSVIIITLIAYIISIFRENRFVKYIFYFLRPASLALICSACFSLVTLSLFSETADLVPAVSTPSLVLMAALFVIIQFVKPAKKLHPIVWIGVSAVCGILFF